jgi:hypothetical protein
MQVMMCAATARAPFPEAKVRKLVLNKNTDKENLVDELQSLKVAVADQAYHFQLHKTHLHGLQIEQKWVTFTSNFKNHNTSENELGQFFLHDFNHDSPHLTLRSDDSSLLPQF